MKTIKRVSGDKLEIIFLARDMKLFIAVFSALTVQSVNALQCWTCEEKSHADCLTYGVSDEEFPDTDCPIFALVIGFRV